MSPDTYDVMGKGGVCRLRNLFVGYQFRNSAIRQNPPGSTYIQAYNFPTGNSRGCRNMQRV